MSTTITIRCDAGRCPATFESSATTTAAARIAARESTRPSEWPWMTNVGAGSQDFCPLHNLNRTDIR